MPSSENNTPFKICILIGFDRSGSSMISRLLSQHPQVNLLFQPFNSTEVTTAQWEYWHPTDKHPDTFRFLQKITEGIVEKDYIRSDWFYNYSKSIEIKSSGVNLIKDTKLHFKTDWLNENFPGIEIFAIWRDPRDILCSLVRNDFHRTWYAHLDAALLQTISTSISKLEKYSVLISDFLSPCEVMALGIAMRTEMLMSRVDRKNILVYEEILSLPDVQLNEFTAKFGLSDFDFGSLLEKDYNVTGKKFEGTGMWRTFFSAAEKEKINRVFKYILK